MSFGSANKRSGFTLVEALAAGVVFLLILGLTLLLTSNLTRVTSRSTASLAAFQEARTAFETMSRILAQAVLNTYWDYDNAAHPEHYLRASELHFVLGPAPTITGIAETAGAAIFCQAPLSFSGNASLKAQPNLLNALGFYVRFSESEDLPEFLDGKETAAWRLWMWLEPAENLGVYALYNGHPQAGSDLSWFQGGLSRPEENHVLANNVILLLIRAGYLDKDGKWRERYIYNSRGGAGGTGASPQDVEIHQLPPVLSVTLVAIDQSAADRLRGKAGGIYRLVRSDQFQDVGEYGEDLRELQDFLNGSPLGAGPVQYRVFETVVNPTSAKWSR